MDGKRILIYLKQGIDYCWFGTLNGICHLLHFWFASFETEILSHFASFEAELLSQFASFQTEFSSLHFLKQHFSICFFWSRNFQIASFEAELFLNLHLLRQNFSDCIFWSSNLHQFLDKKQFLHQKNPQNTQTSSKRHHNNQNCIHLDHVLYTNIQKMAKYNQIILLKCNSEILYFIIDYYQYRI